LRLRAVLLVAALFAISLRAQPVTFTPTSLPNWTVNIPYPATGFAATPSATYTWTATGLPTGMSIDPNSGILSGTPTASGSFSGVMVTATNSADSTLSGSQTYSLTINPAPAITDPTPLPKGNLANTYSYSFGTSPVSFGTPPFTWSQTGGGLPPGLQLNSGVLSGTPTNTGLYGFTITVTDAAGATGSKNFGMIVGTLPIVITVLQSPPASSLTIPYPPPGAPAQPYFSAANGTGTYSWSATGLPSGIVIANPATPILSGTPTQSGTFSVAVQAADTQGGANSVVVSLVINPVPSVSTSSLADCTAGTSCSRSLSATGGTLPITWHITSGSVPAGMNLAGSAISGPPNSVSVPTTSSFTVSATDAVGASGSQALSIRVNPAVGITTGSPLPATTSGQSYSQTMAATGGSGTLTWTGSGLPAWLSISTSGVLSGTAPAVGSATAYPFSLQAADTNGSIASKNFSVTVNPVPTISPSTLTAWTAGQPYSVQLVPVGGTPSFTFSDAGVPSPLPSWLGLSGSTLSGTPPLPGGTAYAFTIRVTDSTGANSTQAYSLQINQPPTVTTSSLPATTSGTSYTQPLNASNGTSPLTWSGLSLPLWLTVSGASLTGIAPFVTMSTNYPFSVKVTDAAGASSTSALSVTVNPIPVILTVTPNTGQQGQSITSVAVVGQGTNFVNGTSVASFGAGITVNSTTVTDAAHATVSITIGAGAAVGARTVTMTTGTEVATLGNGFTVAAAGTPAILSVTPNSGQQGQTLASVAVVGQLTNFVNGTSVASFGAGITVNSTTVTDAAHATVSITIAAGAAVGARTVTMTTGGEVATLANGFTVAAAGTPAILSVTPNSGQQGQTLASAAVVGQLTNFVNGTSVANFGAGITVNSTTVTDAAHATVSITIAAGAAVGARTVTMTTGSEVATLGNGFTVVASGTPAILSVTPNSGQQGQTLASVAVVGQLTNFVNGTSVASFGAGITVNSTTVTDLTHATVSITIAAGAAVGARTVTMTTGSEVATLGNGFTVVTAGTPLILTVTPNTGQQGQIIASVSVVGLSTNFVSGTTVASFGAGITINSTTVTDATHATVSITIAANATAGGRTVTLTTGSEVATLVNGFTVVASGTPLILTVTPNTGQQGQIIASVSVVGLSTNFVNGTTVASFGAGITVNSTTVTDATHATVSITIAAGIATGTRTVTMTTGSEVATLVNGFTVVASGTPLILTVTPNTGQQGQSIASVAVDGLSTNFVNRTTVASFGAGITVNSTTVTDATHATVSITIAAGAAVGAQTVTMTTASEVATLVNGFTVVASGTPLIPTVTPNTGQQGQSIASVSVVGLSTNFVNGTTVASFGAGITVNSTTVTDATHATVSITIAANAAVGGHTVTMTTGSEVATLSNGFTVVTAGTPLILTVTPNTGQQGQSIASVVVVGQLTNFVNGATAASFGAGITVNSTTVTDATHATVSITIAAGIATGARTVTMTTGSEVGALVNAFTVVTAGTPLILTVTPNTGQQGQSIASVSVVGLSTNFVNGTTVASFGAGITVNSTTVTDATHATVSITIAANATAGGRTVTLTTGGEAATLSNGFTVVAPGTPLISTVTPNTGQQGQSIASVRVVGLSTNFVNGTTVANFGPGITVNSTTVTDATHATVSVTIAANTAPVARTVTMTTGSEVDTLANGFTVLAAGTPLILTVTPNTGQPGQSFASVSVVGQATNFVNGTTVADFGADITVNSTTVTDATHATVSIMIAANAASGPRTVTLTTGGEVAALVIGFTVTTNLGTPVILTVTPNTARPGETLANVAVVGLATNFVNGTTVASFGAGVTVNSTTVTDRAHATVSLTIAASATAGPRTVTLVTGNEVAFLISGFAVTFNGVAPVIQSLTPDTGLQGQTFASVAVVGQGTNFVDGTTVADFGPGITVNSIMVTDATHAAVSITIAPDASGGLRTVTLTTGSEVAVSASGFTVTVNTGTPAILTVTPNTGQQEQTLADVQVAGQFTNFVNGRTLADFGPGITVNATTVTDRSHATVSIIIAPGAVPGVRAVTLTTGIEVATTAAGFLVDPAVTITNPNTLQPWTEGRPYSVELAATGGTSPYIFSDPAASLPGWLVLKGSTLSGTPPAPGGTVYSFNLQAADEVGATTTKAFTVLINKPPVVSPTTLPSTTSGLSYSALLTNLGGTAPLTWSASGLPPWLGLAGTSVNGTAPAVTTATTFSFAVTVTDFAGATAQGTVSGTVNPSVSIVTPSGLPPATSGSNYSQALIATGGTAPLTFAIVSGSLPSGLTLGPDGLLFGIPASVTQPTNFQFQVLVTDTLSSFDSKTFVLLVVPQPLTISTAALSSGTAGVAYAMNLEAIGGIPPYTWGLAVGVLPTGIQLDPTSGLLSGKPTEGGSFPLTFSLTDKQGTQVTKAFTLLITSNVKITTPPQLTDGSAGAGYSLTFQTTGASGSVTWSTTQGSLPSGISLDPASGTLSGIPAQVGTFNARVRVQDATGLGASEAIILVINPASIPAVTIGGLNNPVQPDQQLPIALSLSSSFPLDITGQLTVTVTPDPSVGVVDPTVQFGGGGTSVTFRIPANTTQAIFDQVSTLQTGSLAGTISLGATFQSGGAAASPASLVGTSGAVPPLPPMIVGTPTATVTSGSIQISLTALSNTRQVTSATYVFSFAAASNQPPVTVNPPLFSTLVSTWYATTASLSFGSLFGFTQTFTVNGDVSQITGVSITIANDQGTSQAANVSF
jgi:hypothetical protein